MEAGKTESKRIGELARAGEAGAARRKLRGGSAVVARKLSCDGIWAEWTVAGRQSPASEASRCRFAVGAGHHRGGSGKPGGSLAAVATAALLVAAPVAAPPAHAQAPPEKLPKVKAPAG